MRGRIRIGLVASAVALGTCMAGELCYTPMWYNVTITCEGGCGVSYTRCPGAVLCTLSAAGGGPGTIVTQQVACQTYVGGTGTCPNCTAGTLMPPDTWVTVPDQPCPPPCIDYGEN